MNAHTIKDYILQLERENMELRERLESMMISDDEESVVSTDDVNVQLANRFYNKAAEEENHHKKRAYKNAGDVIKSLHFDVTCGEELKHLKGIGRSAMRLIDDWLKI